MSNSIYFGAEKHVYHMTKEVLPWEQPGFIKHGENPSDLMLQLEADELYDNQYKNYQDVWILLGKKYPDCPRAQKMSNINQNQATLAKFVGPGPIKKGGPSTKPAYPYVFNEPSVVQTPADKSYLKPKVQYYEVYVLSAANKYLYSKTLSDETWVDSPLQASHWLQLETAKDRIHYLTNKKFTKVFKLSIPILLEEVKEEDEEVITDDDVLI